MTLSLEFDKVDMVHYDRASHTYDVVQFHPKERLQQNYIPEEQSKVAHKTIRANRDQNQHILPISNLSHKNKPQEDGEFDNKVDMDLKLAPFKDRHTRMTR